MSEATSKSDVRAADFVRPELRALPVYHLDQTPYVHKLDQNEVPWDLPTRFKREALRRLEERTWAFYPDFHGDELRRRLAERVGLDASNVLVGNGSNELLGIALEALVAPGAEVISLLPGFGLYDMFVRRAGGTMRFLPPAPDLGVQMEALIEEVRRDPKRIVLLCTPNNPTGAAATVDEIRALLQVLEAPLLLDNAYGEFADEDVLSLLDEYPQLVIFRTFSKAWSLAGLRLGYLLAAGDLVEQLIKIKLPYNINHASAVIGEVALDHADWAERCVRVLIGRRAQWGDMLRRHGFEVFDSQANFLLARHTDADEIRAFLAEQGILVRKVSHYPGLDNCIRVAIGDGRALRDTDRALQSLLGSRQTMDSHQTPQDPTT